MDIDAQQTETSNGENISHMEIDTRKQEWGWDPIKVIEVCHALQKEHRDDYTKSVVAMRGPLIGIFKIKSDDYTKYEGKSVMLRGVEVKINPRLVKERRHNTFFKKEGFLVTIFGAYDGTYKKISHEAFDEYFDNIDGVEVIRQTEPQRHKGTPTLNDNRFVILKTQDEEAKKNIGTSATINGISFNIRYEGMTHYCFLCNNSHGTECPKKARFEFLKKQRQGKTDKRKIYADSSLRNTNQLALTTDVACMSGGGIGQLCNAITLDKKHDDIVIYAGNNEVTRTNTIEEFVYTVSKAADKLKKLANEINVTLVLPTVPTFGANETAKAQYLEEKMTEIAEIKTIKIEKVEYEGIHPTITGTFDVIERLHKEFGEDVILEGARDDVTTDRKYSKVQPIYKFGCRGCDTTEYTNALCTNCLQEAESVDIKQIEEMIEKIHNEQFPDIDMRTVMKRSLEDTTVDSEDTDGGKSSKNARNGPH